MEGALRTRPYTLSCQEGVGGAVGTLLNPRGWTAHTARVGPQWLIEWLGRAAAARRSLSAIVRAAPAVPRWETVRHALNNYLPGTATDLLPATTRALPRRLPKGLRRRARTLAIDWHLRPYYGQPTTAGVSRGQAKARTKYFFAYASWLVIRRGPTVTVGLTSVDKNAKQTVVLARRLEPAQRAGLRVRRLLLDRAFYGAATIAWLPQQRLAFRRPMRRRGRRGRAKAAGTGTPRFFGNGRRGGASYTWTTPQRQGRRRAPRMTVTVSVCLAPRPKGRGRQTGPLVEAGHRIKASPDTVRLLSRNRFRIETRYRQRGQGWAAPCSTNPVYRLLRVARARVWRKLWVWLPWRFRAPRTARGRPRCWQRLRRRQLRSWLLRGLAAVLAMSPRDITIEHDFTNDT